jgi:hypothetical protein
MQGFIFLERQIRSMKYEDFFTFLFILIPTCPSLLLFVQSHTYCIITLTYAIFCLRSYRNTCCWIHIQEILHSKETYNPKKNTSPSDTDLHQVVITNNFFLQYAGTLYPAER